MDKKLNIGLFIDTFYPMIDGVIQVVDNYARILSKYSNVTVFTPLPRKAKTFNDKSLPYKVVRCRRLKVLFLDYDLPLPNLDKQFKDELEKSNLDIVHIHSPFSLGKIAVKYAKKHKIPCIATMHSQFKQDFYKATKSKLITNNLLKNIMKVFNACDESFAVNGEIAKIFKSYGYKKEPLVLNNGTDFKLIEDREKSDLLVNQKYNLKENDTVLLFVGRITEIKNIFFIIEALKIVKDRGYNFKMLFVGTGQDEDKLKEKIKKLKLSDMVFLCGKVFNRELIKAIYSRAYLFLFPSLYDASSLVQIEAASQKTPTIFLEGAATTGTVTNEINGFIVENDVNVFADKIIEVLNNKDYHDKVAEGAYRDLYLSWEKSVEKAFEKYTELINRKKLD
ncbi:MAG: glycosyltransferase [Clostridia bacterium]|nr:glycosyltransferase [Clostridia bacterium]